ncbi:class II aldolase/adducin family protein [Azotobacter salinestris]|uniref:class II aldolase/adducin family protein n=1 Tax=Azotobacter salinestris TaxID=69964 RepID=UPI001AD66029|nr:class II aldolase/adducin family protein [Azotobacter salinestris]
MTETSKPKSLLMDQAPRLGDRLLPITEAERQARVRLAACYRVFDYLGWTESIFNHITLRVPGPETVFLINPFGLHYSDVTASNLVAVDLEGRPVRAAGHPVNLAGFVIHGAIHGHIQAAHCVMHTHTTTGSAVACLEDGLSHDSFYGAQLHGRVAYHDFEGVTVNLDERERMLASIGDKRVVILRNHGLLSWGETLEEAFMWLWLLQRACDIQVAAAPVGRMTRLPAEVLGRTRLQAGALQPELCTAVFDARVRKVDTLDASYRE